MLITNETHFFTVPSCNSGTLIDGMCLKINLKSSISYLAARTSCQSEGGDLVSAPSTTLLDSVVGFLQESGQLDIITI